MTLKRLIWFFYFFYNSVNNSCSIRMRIIKDILSIGLMYFSLISITPKKLAFILIFICILIIILDNYNTFYINTIIIYFIYII